MKSVFIHCFIAVAIVFSHSMLFAGTVYDFEGVITESVLSSGCSGCDDYYGEIPRDGWGIGDVVNMSFTYDTGTMYGNTLSHLSMQIGSSTYGPMYSTIKATDSTVDSIRYYGLVDTSGGGNDQSIWILFEDTSGSLFSGGGTPVLPDELDLSTFDSITFGYNLTADGYDSYHSEELVGTVVPLPPAGLLLFSGILPLMRMRRKNA